MEGALATKSKEKKDSSKADQTTESKFSTEPNLENGNGFPLFLFHTFRKTEPLFIQRSEEEEEEEKDELHAKLTVSQPNDVYEKEADRIADTVMREPESVIHRKPT